MSQYIFNRDSSVESDSDISPRISAGTLPEKKKVLPKKLKTFWDKFWLEVYCYFFVWVLILTYSLIFRRKMSHNNGIAFEGEVEILKNQTFPVHPFFVAGKKFPCRVRHASVAFMDDAMLCVRSFSIKFDNNRVKSPFDIEMNTGRSLFWTVRNFYELAKMKQEYKGTVYRKYWAKYPSAQQAAQDSLCHNPSSFSKLAYYSQTPTLFIAEDEKVYYVKYRCIPFEGKIESQRNSVAEIGYMWGDQRVEPNTDKHRNYLKDEIRLRIEGGEEIVYKLQLQLMAKDQVMSPMVFNSNIHWDEKVFPWHDLAKVTLKNVLPYEESVLTYFSHANCPDSLGIIPATSIDDYNSVNYLRLKSDLAKKARILAIKAFGMHGPLPDEGPRNIDELTCEKTPRIRV